MTCGNYSTMHKILTASDGETISHVTKQSSSQYFSQGGAGRIPSTVRDYWDLDRGCARHAHAFEHIRSLASLVRFLHTAQRHTLPPHAHVSRVPEAPCVVCRRITHIHTHTQKQCQYCEVIFTLSTRQGRLVAARASLARLRGLSPADEAITDELNRLAVGMSCKNDDF